MAGLQTQLDGLGVENGTLERPPKERKRNAIWSFETVYFEVENEIFEGIKKDLLVPGSYFMGMFDKPPVGSELAKGSNVDNPISLPGAKASHFSALLPELSPWVPNIVRLEKHDEATRLGVLRLANDWGFTQIRERAIRLLEGSFIPNQSSPEKIQLGKDYYVQDWVVDGYVEIIRAGELKYGDLEKAPYNFDDAEVIKKIFYLQARYGFAEDQHQCSWCGNFCQAYTQREFDVHTAVRELLRDEIAGALYVPKEHESPN